MTQWQEDRARSVQFGARHAPVVHCSDLRNRDNKVFGALRTGDPVFVFDDLDTRRWIRGTLTRDSHHLRAAIQVSADDLWTAPWHYIAAARSDGAPHEEPHRGPYEGALYLASEIEIKRDGDDPGAVTLYDPVSGYVIDYDEKTGTAYMTGEVAKRYLQDLTSFSEAFPKLF